MSNVLPPEPNDAEVLDSSHSPVQPVEGKKKTAGLALGAIAVVAVVGGGAYAWTQFNGGGPQPYEEMAEGAVFYVQTNLNPSAEQKLAINDLAKKFPEAKDEDGYDVITAENINGALLGYALESDSDYEMVGDRVGLAVYPDADNDGEPELALAIQITDAKAAEELKKDIEEAAAKDDYKVEVLIEDNYVKVSTQTVEEYFDGTLQDSDTFTLDEVKDNVLAGWVDLAEAQRAQGSQDLVDDFVPADEEAQVEGVVTFGLHARNDGVDFQVFGDKVRVDGEALAVDGKDVSDLLNSITYNDALFSLGIANPGDWAAKGYDALELGDDTGLTEDEVRSALGKQAALSVKYDGGEEAEGKLVLTDVDEDALLKLLAEGDLSLEDAEVILQSQFGKEADITLEDGELVVVLGDEPEGNGDFESGTVVAAVDLDQLYALFSAFSMDDEPTPEDLGSVTFRADLDDEDELEWELSWTTPRD